MKKSSKTKAIALAFITGVLLTGCGEESQTLYGIPDYDPGSSYSNPFNISGKVTEKQTEKVTEKITESITTESKTESITEKKTEDYEQFELNLHNEKINADLFVFYINDKKYTIGKSTIQDLINDGVIDANIKTSFKNSLNNVNTSGIPDAITLIEEEGKYHIALGINIENKPMKDCTIEYLSYYVDNDTKISDKVKYNFSFDLNDAFNSPDVLIENLGKPAFDDTYENTTSYEFENFTDDDIYQVSFNYTDGKLSHFTIYLM